MEFREVIMAVRLSSRVWFLAGAVAALAGAGAYAAQNGPKPPALTFSGPVPPKFLISNRARLEIRHPRSHDDFRRCGGGIVA
jgi:hypothetical protein